MVKNSTSNLYGVIDVGSNSVRLMLNDGERTLGKKISITKLAEGLGNGSRLQVDAMERTAQAVSFFVEDAKKAGVEDVWVFATAAVRQATNGKDFVDRVKSLCGIGVDVISGEEEAEIGLLGALCGKDGGIIDIGGASTEISALNGGKKIFGKSLPLGCVKITEICGQDLNAVDAFVRDKILEFGEIPKVQYYGIGGTATTIAAVIQSLKVYDPNKVHGFEITKNNVYKLRNLLFSMTVEERKKLNGLQPARAEVIAGGTALLYAIMDTLGVEKIFASENDNLEGYLLKHIGEKYE